MKKKRKKQTNKKNTTKNKGDRKHSERVSTK